MFRGDRLRSLREGLGVSRERLAVDLGIGTSQIQRHEASENDASGEYTTRYAKYFNVSTDYLLGVTDDPSPHIEGVLSPKEAGVISFMRRGERVEAIKAIVSDE